MTRWFPEARDRADAVVTALLVASFALLPIFEARLTKTVAVADVLLALAALVLLVAGPMGRTPWRLAPRWFVVGLGLVLVGGLVGLVGSSHALDSGVLLGRLLVASAGTFVVLAWWDPPPAVARTLLAAYVAGATLSAGLGALSATVLQRTTEWWRDPIDRATGLTGNANHLGAATCIGLVIALGLAATTSRRPWQVAWLACAAVLGAGLLWSGSRSALVGVAAGALVVAARLWVERRRTPLVVVAAAGVVLLLLAVVGVVRVPALDRLLLRTDTTASTYSVVSTEARLELAEQRLEGAGWDSLLVGAGMENRDTQGGHSGHLEVWVGTGLLGFAGWVTVVVGLLGFVVRAVRRRGALSAREAVVLAAGAGYVAHVASTVFLEHIWDRYIWLLVALIVVVRPPTEALGAGAGAGAGAEDERPG